MSGVPKGGGLGGGSVPGSAKGKLAVTRKRRIECQNGHYYKRKSWRGEPFELGVGGGSNLLERN